jgi:hypothetical protein
LFSISCANNRDFKLQIHAFCWSDIHTKHNSRLTKMHAKALTCLNFFNFHPVSAKFRIDKDHVILTNRMFFVYRIATFLAGKWRHKLAAKKLTVSYC